MEPHEHPHGQGLSWEDLAVLATLPSRPVNFANVTGGTALFQGRCIVTGYTMQNQNAGASNFNLRDGLDANGVPIVLSGPAAGTRVTASLPGVGVLAVIGVYLDTGAGPFQGSVYIIDPKQQLGKRWPR